MQSVCTYNFLLNCPFQYISFWHLIRMQSSLFTAMHFCQCRWCSSWFYVDSLTHFYIKIIHDPLLQIGLNYNFRIPFDFGSIFWCAHAPFQWTLHIVETNLGISFIFTQKRIWHTHIGYALRFGTIGTVKNTLSQDRVLFTFASQETVLCIQRIWFQSFVIRVQ